MSDRSDKIKKKKNKGQKTSRNIIIALSALLVIIIAVIGISYYLIQHYIHNMHYISDDEVAATSLAQDEASKMVKDALEKEILNIGQDGENGTRSPEEQSSIAIELESIAAAMQQTAEAVPMKSDSDVYNLLLIGIDNRVSTLHSSWNGNSDSMILVSINMKKKEIYMTSFMRDTYVNIGEYGACKLNEAHAIGAGPLLVQTIEDNFKIDIDNYATIDFYSLCEVIDNIGGLDITLSNEEAEGANYYITEICKGFGLNANDYYLTVGGENMHLNGIQATAYARIRYVGNSDFERTYRQRVVLTKLFDKLKGSDIATVDKFLNAALPKVTHNISDEDLMKLINNAPTYLTYGLVANLRVPFDDMWSVVGEMLVTDFMATNSKLTSIIY